MGMTNASFEAYMHAHHDSALFKKGLDMSWEEYEWRKQRDIGKLTYYYCNVDRSDLPIRDICNDHGAGRKEEPHYGGDFRGFGTYNECASCNHNSIDSMVENKKANLLFFVTWYTGKNHRYRRPERRYFVTGYYRIDEIKKVDRPTRYAIKCYEPFFVGVEDAFEITEEVLREWRPNRKKWETYGDQMKFYLIQDQLNQLVFHFKRKKNRVNDYINETERVAAECGKVARKDKRKSASYR